MNKKHIGHSDDSNFEQKVKDLLLYHKVVSVEQIDAQTAKLILDNGVALLTKGNRGCGGCNNGWYEITDLNDCDNIITNVECVINAAENGYEDAYHIFVYAEDKRINLVEYEGEDNGYYGTGYDLYVLLEVEE